LIIGILIGVRWYLIVVWFASLLYPGKLNTSSCIVPLPLRIPYLIHVPISSLECWLFGGWAVWVPCRFWILVPYQMSSWQRFFSHSVGCLLSLVTVFFAVQKLFSLMQSHLFIVSLRCWAFGVLFRKSIPISICSSVFHTPSWSCF
jgi:hypothetical protein